MQNLIHIWQYLRNKFLFLVWLGLVIAPGVAFNWLEDKHPDLVPSSMVAVIIVGYIVYGAVTFYLLISTIHHLDDDVSLSPLGGAKRALGDLRSLLTFIPILGGLFEVPKDRSQSGHEEK